MDDRRIFLLILFVTGLLQFLVVPFFSSQSLGGKVVVFSVFVILLAVWMISRQSEFFVPVLLIPLICLAVVFIVSLCLAMRPELGIVDLGTFILGVLFCLLVANLSACDYRMMEKRLFAWLRIIGLIVAFLCLYQYLDWLVNGQKTETLIPYLLPPGNHRVNGVYGQSNLTALLLVLSIVAFLTNYQPVIGGAKSQDRFGTDVGLFCVGAAFFLTGSRAGLLSLILVFLVLGLLVWKRQADFTRRWLLKPVCLLAVAYLVSQVSSWGGISSSATLRPEISTDARFLFWASSILMFLDFPLLGVGLDHFKVYLPSYALQGHDLLGFVKYEAMGYTQWSHNEIFQILAESGVVGFLFISLFFFFLLRMMFKELTREHPDPGRTFLFLLVIPFVNQGMFSWPLRYPALLPIFFLLLGVILAKSSNYKINLHRSLKFIAITFLLATLPVIGYFSYKDNHFVRLKKEVTENGCGSTSILSTMDDPNLSFKMMREVLPLCTTDESFIENQVLVEQFKPFYFEIAQLQGTHSQWYNLGLIYHSLGEYTLAEQALQKSVERQPVFELGWSMLHFLHIEEAVRKTGRPIEDFLPPEKKLSTDYYDSLFKRQ